ncbi:RIP metalloprotease RseP [Xinfangfangia sp. CPCC 101601]|uniref:Zinc metalloprotease n=1 Tax=Pseudogemmobacter lacusdianii TaxID=3069608 RepID=A0ABU0W219_9RHOB|nr:RIP metalloprotease RseP [Xinfangfangia sp. CPCC 101601]MDQ2068016.1 RIP metalloprotease RseP [Xinfangfangia sp. CPCC 101601]
MSDVIAALGGSAWAVIWAGFFFIIALSIIVAVHEYGHYIVGRWTGIHAEVFSVGFGKVLLSRTDKRGTKWQIAAIPFGGYVKFLGDADASSVRSAETAGLSADERRHTMAGAPLWARAATVAAGPLANFILTFVVLVIMGLVIGIPDGQPRVERALPLPYEGQMLQDGDVILAVNGLEIDSLRALSQLANGNGDARDAVLPETPTVDWTVERAGQVITFPGPHPAPAMVNSVQVKSAAVDAGVRSGDVIIEADGNPITTFMQLREIVTGSGGKPVPLTVWRDGTATEMVLTPRQRDIPQPDGSFKTEWLMGISQGLIFEPGTRRGGLGESVTGAFNQMWGITTGTFSGLYHMVAGRLSTCNMSGVIGMADALGDAAKVGPEAFFSLFAIISFGIGLLNLFPIPVLDGGHLVFHAYEAVARRPPSDRALQVLMSIGLTLLLSLMAFALLQDLICV